MNTPTQTVRIRSRLAALMESREIPTLTALAVRSGLSYPTLMGLYHDQSRQISFPVLVKLCEALECTPGDLLALEGQTWTPESGQDQSRIRDLVETLAQEVGVTKRPRVRRKAEPVSAGAEPGD